MPCLILVRRTWPVATHVVLRRHNFAVDLTGSVDFFTAEVWTGGGLIMHDVVVIMRVASREV